MKRIENITVSFDLAKKLKKIGFNYQTNKFYTKDGDSREAEYDDFNDLERGSDWHYCSAPTYEEVKEWFRREHKIEIEIAYNFTAEKNEDLGWGATIMTNIDDVDTLKWMAGEITGNWYKSTEQANEEAIKEAIKYIK